MLGSIPPNPHEHVPPFPTCNSLTFGDALCNDVTGPMAPETLNSELVNTSKVAPKAMDIYPASGCGGWFCAVCGSVLSPKRWNTRRNDSLNTDCPKESPSTVDPPVASTNSRISNNPTWSKLQAKTSSIWYGACVGLKSCFFLLAVLGSAAAAMSNCAGYANLA